jgi:ATP-dependent Lhr-like helicase
VPVAVFERLGKVLRVFDEASLLDALRIFVQDYTKHRLYPTLNRLIVKEYPGNAVDALSSTGFIREMQDYVMYRRIIT